MPTLFAHRRGTAVGTIDSVRISVRIAIDGEVVAVHLGTAYERSSVIATTNLPFEQGRRFWAASGSPGQRWTG